MAAGARDCAAFECLIAYVAGLWHSRRSLSILTCIRIYRLYMYPYLSAILVCERFFRGSLNHYPLMRKIVLASTSPRRRALLRMVLGDNFEVRPSSYEEDNTLDMEPRRLVMQHALGKASNVAHSFDSGIVIGADSVVVFDGKVIGKPKDADEARQILHLISGQRVEVMSGIAIIDIDRSQIINEYVSSFVVMEIMTDREIDDYIRTQEPLDKAGAFAAQGIGSVFIKRIDGCFFNVVGLPLHRIYRHLKALGVSVFEQR